VERFWVLRFGWSSWRRILEQFFGGLLEIFPSRFFLVRREVFAASTISGVLGNLASGQTVVLQV
jgi:hypothetical protein